MGGGSSLALAFIVVVVNTETGRVLWVTTLNITVKGLLQAVINNISNGYHKVSSVDLLIEVGLPARGTLEQCTLNHIHQPKNTRHIIPYLPLLLQLPYRCTHREL